LQAFASGYHISINSKCSPRTSLDAKLLFYHAYYIRPSILPYYQIAAPQTTRIKYSR
jgi:hypothetical protein